jgi:glycerol-3-phosphate dehydrogenase
VFSFKEEFAQKLVDCLMRRTMIGLSSSRGMNSLTAAAQIGKRYLGWSDARAEEEVNQARKSLSGV